MSRCVWPRPNLQLQAQKLVALHGTLALAQKQLLGSSSRPSLLFPFHNLCCGPASATKGCRSRCGFLAVTRGRASRSSD